MTCYKKKLSKVKETVYKNQGQLDAVIDRNVKVVLHNSRIPAYAGMTNGDRNDGTEKESVQ